MEHADDLARPTADRCHSEHNHAHWWDLLIRHFPIRDFILGGLIPYVLFLIFQRRGEALAGVMLASCWGMAIMLVAWIWTRRVQGFAALTVVFTGIHLVTTMLTRSTTGYLLSGVINTTIEGLIYFVSVWFPRPLVQIAAETMGATATVPVGLRCSPAYRHAWQILTAICGLVNLAKAGLLLLAQWALPEDVAMALGVLSGWPLFLVLLAFSFWFPGWYWSRGR